MWKRTLASIEGRLNRQVFDAWFRPIELAEGSDSGLKLKVPNKFFKEWLANNYMDVIKDALFAESGHPMDVEFVVAPKAAACSEKAPVERLPAPVPLPRPAQTFKSHLNPKYTFANFVVGASNQLPHAASVAVTEMVGKRYNPLFLYGGVGLGKTHLIHAIGNEIKSRNPDARIYYVSSEQFMNEFVHSLRNDRSLRDNKMDAFRQRFRKEIDVLLMDDIQFIAGKDRTQDEFFHTFNALYEQNKQIVLASDKYPQEIPDLEERLCSRFQWGLIADIQPPELETRLAIVQKKSEDEQLGIPDDVAMFLASSIKSNVRELEGSLINLAAHASLEGCPIDLAFAKETLSKVISLQQSAVTVESVQETVCKAFSVSLAQLTGSGRKRSHVLPRQVAMYLCRKGLNSSLPEIGERFGNRDHTTALAACRKVERLLKTDLNMRGRVEALERLLGF
jgi:chromosomal replication initiator protein